MGQVSAAITKVPAAVSCIDIQVASGARTVDRQFTVTPGQPALLTLQGLPLGSVVFNGFAYATACSAVNASSVADYATDPVAATLAPGVFANVGLDFHAAGAATVGIDFDDAGIVPSIAVTPLSLAYAVLFCGASGQSQSFSVENVTSVPITVSAVVSAGAPLAVSPASATIAPGATASFAATETPIAAPYAVGPIAASITLTTSLALDAPHVLPANLFVGSALFQFSAVTPLGATESAVLTNAGNESATFALTKSPSTSTATISPSSGTLAPGQSVTIEVGASPIVPFSATNIQLSSTNELCQVPPSFSFVQE
jgi:hypothetical protein